MAARVARGDVRLYQFAPPDKNRPVVVRTRDSAIAYLSTVTVAPISEPFRRAKKGS
jgi:mRNA-degrading endonuclease toxin of MazEF toxin-antitoxin module